MWTKIVEFSKNITWPLAPGIHPPHATEELAKSMDSTAHLMSKKFFMTFFALLLVTGFFFAAVGLLFMLPTDAAIAGMVTMFVKIAEIVAMIVSVMILGQSAVDLKYGSNNSTNYNTNTVTEEKESNIKKEIISNTKEDDYSISMDDVYESE